MTKRKGITFSLNLNNEDLEKEIEKSESMNNIMATDEYKVKLEAEVKAEPSNIEINLTPKCSK